jgi:hypothetical protein
MLFVDADYQKDTIAIMRNPLTEEKLNFFLDKYLPKVDAKKALGILYPLIMQDEELDHYLLTRIYSKVPSRSEAIALAYHYISQREDALSQYGDAAVTESLNYFMLDGEPIRAYYTVLGH